MADGLFGVPVNAQAGSPESELWALRGRTGEGTMSAASGAAPFGPRGWFVVTGLPAPGSWTTLVFLKARTEALFLTPEVNKGFSEDRLLVPQEIPGSGKGASCCLAQLPWEPRALCPAGGGGLPTERRTAPRPTLPESVVGRGSG